MTKQYISKISGICDFLGGFISRVIIFPLKLLAYGILQLINALVWSRLWGKMASRDDKGTSSTKNENVKYDVDGSTPQAILDVRRHHKQAYVHIDKALRIDETAGNDHYCKG